MSHITFNTAKTALLTITHTNNNTNRLLPSGCNGVLLTLTRFNDETFALQRAYLHK